MENKVIILDVGQGEFDGFPKNKTIVESVSKARDVDEMYIGEFTYKDKPIQERGIYTDDVLYLDMSIEEMTDDSIYVVSGELVIGKVIYLERFLRTNKQALINEN